MMCRRRVAQRRVFESQRREQCVAHHFDVHGGIMQIALGLIHVEQRQRDLILHDVQIGARFRGQHVRFNLGFYAPAKTRVILALVIEGRRTHIIELLIQVPPLISM